MEAILWIGLGALIGYAASQRKGFSAATGLIGGVLLGPLAVLMFAVSGGSDQKKKCPYCAEWIQPKATVCKHCHKDLPAGAAVRK